MKRSDLILCFLLILLMRSEARTSDGSKLQQICAKYREERPHKVLNVFNLHNDVIIQIKGETQPEAEFWRIYDTDSEDFEKGVNKGLKIYPHHNILLPDTTKIGDWTPENLDINKRIIGYVAPLPIKIWEDCKNQTYEGNKRVIEDNGCEELSRVHDDNKKDFVCIHGSSKDRNESMATNVYIFHSGVFEDTLSYIQDSSLREFVNKSCITNSYHFQTLRPLTPIAIVNWPEGDYYRTQYFSNLSIMVSPYLPKGSVMFMGFETKNDTFVATRTSKVAYSRAVHSMLFRFNSYYKFMYCGEDCTLDFRLDFVNLVDDPNNHMRSQIRMKFDSEPLRAYLAQPTLRKLMGCPLRAEPEFNPNQFCVPGTDRITSIISAFSLGFDVYFQGRGIFWHWPHNRYDKTESPNKYHIRIESDLVAFLEEEKFDTSEPIIGFSFISPFIDRCGNDIQCNHEAMETNEYFRVCLFGWMKVIKHDVINIKTTKDKALQTFCHEYSPIGFKRLRTKVSETLQLCKNILKAHSSRHMVAITSPNNPTDLLNRVYAYYVNTVEKKWLTLFSWPKEELTESPTRAEYELEDTVPIVSLFSVGFSSDMYAFINGKMAKLQNITTFKFVEWIDYRSYFKCPFQSAVSFVRTNAFNVCQRLDVNLAQSVFTIGRRLYHQIGDNFYIFDKKTNKFHFDKYISDLLSEFFDTDHRLTGFSVNTWTEDHFDVLIHGKSSEQYEHMGPHLYALFNISRDTNMPYLTVIKDKRYSEFNPKSTFTGDMSSIVFIANLSNWADFPGDIHYMGGTSGSGSRWPDLNFVWYWVRESRGEAHREDIYSIRLFELNDWFNRFKDEEIRFNLWRTHEPTERQYRRSLGFYTDAVTGQMFFVGQQSNDSELTVYLAVDYISKLYYFGFSAYGLNDFKKTVTYREMFCTSAQHSDDASDSDLEKWNTTFAILLIILLVLSIVIAIIKYQKNQKKIPKTRTNDESKDK